MDIHDLIAREYGIRTIFRENVISFPSSPTAMRILGYDPNRIAVVLVNLGTSNIFVHVRPDVSATNGIFVASSGGSVSLVYRDDFILVSNEWYGFNQTGETSLYVVEILIRGEAS